MGKYPYGNCSTIVAIAVPYVVPTLSPCQLPSPFCLPYRNRQIFGD